MIIFEDINSALSEMLKNIMNILRDNFLTVRDKKKCLE
jgi:hypothetical protein